MKKILFICGSLNQTTQMHQISARLADCDCHFTPFYADGLLRVMTRAGMLDFTILGGGFRASTEEYLSLHCLKVDYEGANNNYDLVLTCSDLIVPRNIRKKHVVLIQE